MDFAQAELEFTDNVFAGLSCSAFQRLLSVYAMGNEESATFVPSGGLADRELASRMIRDQLPFFDFSHKSGRVVQVKIDAI